MKKIFTLLVSVTMVASAFAQYDAGKQRDNGYDKGYDKTYDKGYDKTFDKGYGKGNDVIFNDNGFGKGNDHFADRNFFKKREMAIKIAQINREYDYKIQSVKSNYFMPWFKKQRMISRLEDQRQDEIKAVYFKFSDRRDRFDDHDQRRNW